MFFDIKDSNFYKIKQCFGVKLSVNNVKGFGSEGDCCYLCPRFYKIINLYEKETDVCHFSCTGIDNACCL